MAEPINIVEKAAAYARHAHESIGQLRKYTGEPYIVHPRAVAQTVASVTDDENMICAAWLHDVVEDTPITLEEIRSEFGDDVAHLVDGLTNPSKPEDGNRKARVAIDKEHNSLADARTKTIRLADMIDNLTDIVKQNAGFARKYLAEKEDLLNVLTEGNQELYRRVFDIIQNEKAKLSEASE